MTPAHQTVTEQDHCYVDATGLSSEEGQVTCDARLVLSPASTVLNVAHGSEPAPTTVRV